MLDHLLTWLRYNADGVLVAAGVAVLVEVIVALIREGRST